MRKVDGKQDSFPKEVCALCVLLCAFCGEFRLDRFSCGSLLAVSLRWRGCQFLYCRLYTLGKSTFQLLERKQSMMRLNGNFLLIAVLLCGVFVFAGCGGSATTTPTSTTASTSTGDKIGVPECDEYIEKVEACLNSKVPEA